MPFGLKTFLHQAGADPLRSYVEERAYRWPEDFDWEAPPKRLAATFIGALNSLPDRQRQQVDGELHQVWQLEGELGQQALRDACAAEADLLLALKQLGTDQARGLAVLLRKPELFELALAYLFSDRRHGSTCHQTYRVATTAAFVPDDDAKEAFRLAAEAVYRERLKVTRRVVADITMRGPDRGDGRAKPPVAQVTIYQEADARSAMVFDGDELTADNRREAKIGALTYDVASGELSIAAPGGAVVMERLVAAFVRCFLEDGADIERLAKQEYELAGLKWPRRFDVDANDPVADVVLDALELRGLSDAQPGVTIRRPARAKESLWTLAGRLFGPENWLHDPTMIAHRAEIVVTFEPASGERRKKRLRLVLTERSCNLREHGERECLVLHKYLPRWGLLKNDDGRHRIQLQRSTVAKHDFGPLPPP